MALRKWIVRSLVFAILGGLGVGAFLYFRWTDPVIVRQMVVDQFNATLPGGQVTVDSARLRLLGGIAFQELRLVRRDDKDRTDVFYVPEGVIYHDKEQLARGQLAIRKIELSRARVRVVRDREGRWNLRGLLGPVDLSKGIPTLVLKQSTILFEDRICPGCPVTEVRDVSVTLLNDPLPTLNFTAAGQADVAGVVHMQGAWQRASGEVTLQLALPTVAVGQPLVQRLSGYFPQLAEDARHLEGSGEVKAQLHYRPDSRQWDHDLRARLSKGRLRHAMIPLPLEELEVTAQLVKGRLTVEKLTARAGEARLHLAGERESLDPNAEMRGEAKVENLAVNADFFEKLPPSLHNLRKIQTDFSPEGRIDLVWKAQAKENAWVHQGTITPRGLALCFTDFRYPVSRVTGELGVHVGPDGQLEHLTVSLLGSASGEPVTLRGTVSGPKPAAVDLTITGKNIPLDETFLGALPAHHQERARSFHAKGKTDFEAFIRRDQGQPRFANRYLARLHGTQLCYDQLPCLLEDVRATLEMFPNHWELRDFVGTHRGAEIRGQGRSVPQASGQQRVYLEFAGSNLILDDTLKGSLERSPAKGVRASWEALQPTGRFDFEAKLDLPPDQAAAEYDVKLVARHCTIHPTFFRYTLHDLLGEIHCTKGKVGIRALTARHGASAVRIEDGEIILKPGGGFFVKIPRLEANPLMPEEDLLRALPGGLQTGAAALQLREPISLATQLIVDVSGEPGTPAVFYWDGGIALKNAQVRLGVPFEQVSGQVFTAGRYNGRQLEGVRGHVLLEQALLFDQPLRNIHGKLEVWKDMPDVLSIPALTANFFGGTIGGQARVEFGALFRYEVDLTALQVKLDQVGRNLREKLDLSGEVVARLYLKGEGTDLKGLEGGGSIDIPNGKLYNLPLLLDLLKFLAVRWPDRTAFEEAHARFSIHGPRVSINRLELLGNVVSLGGEGHMNLDGSQMDLDLYAVWGRIMQVLPASVRELPPWVSKQLLRIKARGPVSDPRFEREAVPMLTEPLRNILQRMSK